MTDPVPYDDKHLLERLKNGDEQVITIIYLRYWEQLFTSSYRLLKDRAACEDIVQDIFLRLWQNRATLVITTSLEGYLFTAVRYRVFTTIERGHVNASLFNELEERLWVRSESDTRLYQKELQARIFAIVAHLPDKCQQIYRMSREEQLSHKEIADQLSITVKTVENQLTIALRKIRKGLPELFSLIAFLIQ